jgi:hypothetical protein
MVKTRGEKGRSPKFSEERRSITRNFALEGEIPTQIAT